MRKIKFRAWDKSNNEMFPVRILKWDNWMNIVEGAYPTMQYTGLKDENGVEIYEGDIVKYDDYEIFVVVWDHFGWSFSEFIKGVACNEMWLDSDCEVIGNIYENSDLLEEGRKCTKESS